jgi:hypothetical protein
LLAQVEDFRVLLGKGRAHLRQGQSFGDSWSRRATIGAGVPPVVMMQIQESI